MGKKAGKKKYANSKKNEKQKQNQKVITPKRKQRYKKKKLNRKSKSVNNVTNKKQSKSKITEKTVINNGEVELDQAVEDITRYKVVEAKPSEYEDKFYAVTLNYTNIQNNNNKFYKIQLLQDIHTKKFGVLYRWGRIGFFGQVNYVIYETFEEAREAFLIKLQSKLEYGYIKIKMENKIKEEKINDSIDKSDDGLEKPLANLIRLVFDLKTMNQHIMKIGYDSDKIPLGQISSEVISKGYQYLKKIENIINNKNNIKNINTKEIYDLSSSYFTIIPHNFGMNHMHKFVINSQERIKEENELLDSIKNIKIVSGILQQTNNIKNEEKNEISLKEKLNEFIYEIKYISKKENIYSLIDKYLSKSNDIKNSPKIKLNDLFLVKEKNPAKNMDKKNKKLLWYGIGIPNFVNVFKSGLSLPSPEAPIYSYMFGKGIYFSDIAIKSFYNSHPQNNIGLMLLCEVDLGNIEERLKADVNLPNTLEQGKNSVKVLGMNYPDEKGSYFNEEGVEIPMGDILINQDENKKTYFGFNEYIVYNLEQIKIKYILKVQFDK